MDNRYQQSSGFAPRAVRTGNLQNRTGHSMRMGGTTGTTGGTARGQDCGCRSGSQERSPLMRRLQELDLALIDTGLYLDAYPDNRDALCYFARLTEERARVLAEYERQYGPMTLFGAGEKNGMWDWTRLPWPWENEETQGGMR